MPHSTYGGTREQRFQTEKISILPTSSQGIQTSPKSERDNETNEHAIGEKSVHHDLKNK